MKKTLSLILSVTMLAGCVSCSNAKQESSEYVPPVDEQGREIVTIGILNEYYRVDGLESKSFPSDISIEYRNYRELSGDESFYGENALGMMRNDLISGQAPDIILIDPLSMAQLINLGVMTDMYPLMDSYEDGIHREDFLPNVLAGFEHEGKLPALSEKFFIATAAAKTKFVGEDAENWTPEQAMQAFSSLPEGTKFMKCYTDSALTGYMTRCVDRQCIDLVSNTCNFTDSAFTDLLKFSLDNPIGLAPDFTEDMSAEDVRALSIEEASEGLNDTYLVYDMFINGFGSGLAENTYAFFGGEDITFVGYPSTDGNGAYTSSNTMYGISESCQNKETAWRVISYITGYREPLDEKQVRSIGLPVLLENLDKDYNLPDSYNNSISHPVTLYGMNDPVTITEEYKKMLYDYILSVEFDPYTDIRVNDIIAEEIQAVVAGERSPEDCAEIIQSRVSIYLSERS